MAMNSTAITALSGHEKGVLDSHSPPVLCGPHKWTLLWTLNASSHTTTCTDTTKPKPKVCLTLFIHFPWLQPLSHFMEFWTMTGVRFLFVFLCMINSRYNLMILLTPYPLLLCFSILTQCPVLAYIIQKSDLGHWLLWGYDQTMTQWLKFFSTQYCKYQYRWGQELTFCVILIVQCWQNSKIRSDKNIFDIWHQGKSSHEFHSVHFPKQ